MKLTIRNTFVLAILLLINLQLLGQIKVSKVFNKNFNASPDGFYYSLPQTVLKIDLVVEKIQKIPGPLSEYSREYLGTSDFITTNSTSYRVVNVDVEQVISADPKQLYYVQFPTEKPKDEKSVAVQLTPYGTLWAYDDLGSTSTYDKESRVDQTFFLLEGNEDFKYFADYNRQRKIDTIVKKISIDTTTIERFVFRTNWVNKSASERANEAAMQISRIRDARFNLISGYQEVNYGQSMYYMDSEMLKLERQYLDLFLGKEVKTLETHTIYYIPEKDKLQDVIFKGANSSPVEIFISIGNSLELIPDSPLDKADNLYYRIPEIVTVEIKNQGGVYFRENVLISQFGVVAAVPVLRNKIQFDPKTGNLVKIVKE
ncbi:MAG TPA: DUF4831 family protein [Bacteroidales bacterium]